MLTFMRTKTKAGQWSILITVSLVLFASNCGGLPKDFESLTLEEKIEAYKHHRNAGGMPLVLAHRAIAWHGWDAADLMARHLRAESGGLPAYDAVLIINYVQTGGCSLRGSTAEEALEDYLEDIPPDSLEALETRNALDAIHDDSISSGLDRFNDGPCAETGDM